MAGEKGISLKIPTVNKIVTFAVMFVIMTALVRFLPPNVKRFFVIG